MTTPITLRALPLILLSLSAGLAQAQGDAALAWELHGEIPAQGNAALHHLRQELPQQINKELRLPQALPSMESAERTTETLAQS